MTSGVEGEDEGYGSPGTGPVAEVADICGPLVNDRGPSDGNS